MSFLSKLNLAKQCKAEFNVPVWKCPTFLFILMGLIAIVSILTAYLVAANYGSAPEVGALSSLVSAAIILILGHVIIQSFTRVIEVDRLKSQFLNIVSHQLLTPLTSLKWSVSMLETESLKPDKEKLEEAYGMIRDNSNKMIHIINALLDVSRIETGKVIITPERVDVLKVTRDVLASRKGELESQRHRLELKADENLPAVRGDTARVKMAMENLVDNAIKYSKPDSPIFVSLWAQGGSVVFEIRDTGVGIPMHEHKHIFRKFFRSANELSLQTKGLGVGLYLVKFIIEALGGSVDFESQEGVGSTFWLSLPVHKP